MAGDTFEADDAEMTSRELYVSHAPRFDTQNPNQILLEFSMTLNMTSTIPQLKNANAFRGLWWQHLCTAMVIVVGITAQDVATAQSTPNYVYFMDAFTPANVLNTPADIAVIGETEATGIHARSILTAGGRIVGTQTEFNASSNITWTNALNTLFNNPPPPLSNPPDLSTSVLRKEFA